MTRSRLAAGGLLAAALAAGTLSDSAPANPPRTLGGYHVLAVDFHIHSFPQTWSTLAPWDTVIEAGHQGLDAIAMVPHDQVWAAKVGHWFAGAAGGAIVLVGEEITTPGYHLLAVGITERVATDLTAARAIDDIHRQGGVAIAAHPYRWSWPAYDAEAMQKLDGSEVVRPETAFSLVFGSELDEFFQRAPLTPIGASDYHGLGLMGHARTFVFAKERTERGILDAVRDGRTIVYGNGRVYGDPGLIELAAHDGTLDRGVPQLPVPGAARLFSRITGVLGLVLAAFVGRRS